MSYRLLKTSEREPDVFYAGYFDYTAKGLDGVIAGIFDEVEVSSQKDMLILGRGKLLVSGYSVLFEGKEVVGVPRDFIDGEYMLVGVLNVSGRRAQSFYLALRDKGEVQQSDVLKEGEGVYEIKIAEFILSQGQISNVISCLQRIVSAEQEKVEIEGDISAVNALAEQNTAKIATLDEKVDSLALNSEKSFAKALDGSASGKIFLTDSQDGYFSEFEILGKAIVQGSTISTVGSSIPICVRGKNIFNYKAYAFSGNIPDNRDMVYYENLSRKQKTEDGKYIVCGNRTNPGVSSDNANGLFQIRINTLNGYYKHNISFDVTLNEEWKEGNVDSVFSFAFTHGGVKVEPTEHALVLGEKKHFSFNVTTQMGIALFDINLFGLGVTIERIQIERANAESEYVDGEGQNVTFKIQDKSGKKYSIASVGNVSDVVTIKDGKPVLIKKVGYSTTSVTDALEGAEYFSTISNGISQDGTIETIEGEKILYVLKTPQVIELDEKLVQIDKIKTYTGVTEITTLTSVLPNFNVKYGRNLVSVIRNLETMIAGF